MNIIKDARKNKALTQQELADKCEMGKGAIVAYETGRRKPNARARRIFNEVLGISLVKLNKMPITYIAPGEKQKREQV